MIRRPIYIAWALLALLAGGCSDNSDTDLTAEYRDAVPLDVRVSAEARAADGSQIVYPDGQIGEQHTTTVHVYVFEGTGSEASYTGFRADVGWSDHFTRNPDPSTQGLPHHTAQMRYRLGYRFTEGGSYTLLGIAVNRAGRQAFGIPLDFPAGTTPQQLTARLQPQLGTASLRDAELYVGSRELTIDKSHQEVPTLEMHRRVAGVMGCFENVPERILHDGVLHPVTEIRIALYTAQNTALPLVARRQQPFFEDFIASPADGNGGEVLLSIPVAGIAPQGVVQGGAYVLPAAAPRRGVYTLHVDLTDNGTLLRSIRVKLPANDGLDQGQTGGGTGIIDAESAFRFPLVANHFYALGTPSAPIDLKGNGSDITISIDPAWREDNDLDIEERPSSR